MDRFALFVDAGHLLAEGGSLCCGTKKRSSIECDYDGLIVGLSEFCRGHCLLDLLRVYWYDGAPNAVPGPDHLVIGQLPFTKLRLGRISGGKQKGVDSLIVRDLMTLARERAIATAFLLAGDEDVREGMVAAQEMGVAVNVLGIPTTSADDENQAPTLIREADQHILLPTAFLERYIRSREPHLPFPGGRADRASSQEPRTGHDDSTSAALAAAAFAARWLQAHHGRVGELLAQAPVIPRNLDAQLLSTVEAEIGRNLRKREDLRKDVRAAFWSSIKATGLAGDADDSESGVQR